MKRENKGVYKISYNNRKGHFGEPLGAGGAGAMIVGPYLSTWGNMSAKAGPAGPYCCSTLAIPRLFPGYSLVLNFGFFLTGSLAKLAALPGEE